MGIRPDGRWGGQVTSRALPADPSIALLSVEDRRTIAEVWIGRAASERRVATSFELIHDALAGLGAAPELVRLADRAIDDEHRHAELCRLVASRFAGRELAPPALLPHGYPQHPSASESLRRTLWVVGHCLLNETTASAFLEVTLEHATGALARAACRELLSDEIDHARLGWAHLAAVGPEVRAEVGRWLPRLARANLRMWRASPRPEALTDAVVAHGHPRPEVLDAALVAATRELVVPGCEQLGLDVAEVTAWLDAGAPT
ncbi:MAG: ferritin-like domain-containing protein [Deltaproteobacteria bacterium]|nr:ferritin-like domain-containing protein [Deltaproteobacteria bacterium]